MELGDAMMWILGSMLLVGMLLVLYMSMDIKRIAEEEVKVVEEIVLPVKQKRQYKKRGTYWNQPRKRKAAKKARKKTPA